MWEGVSWEEDAEAFALCLFTDGVCVRSCVSQPSKMPFTALTFRALLLGFPVRFSPCIILAASRLILT